MYYENMELRKFVEFNGRGYAVDYEITTKNKVYIVAIRELTKALITEEDYEKHKMDFKIDYNGNWYLTKNINGFLKFLVSEKKKSINWTYRTSDGAFKFTKDEGLKQEIEKVTKQIKLIHEYEQMVFVKSA